MINTFYIFIDLQSFRVITFTYDEMTTEERGNAIWNNVINGSFENFGLRLAVEVVLSLGEMGDAFSHGLWNNRRKICRFLATRKSLSPFWIIVTAICIGIVRS